jgi:hypothetical protein
MDQAALSGLDLKVACAIVVAVPWRRDNSADAIIWKDGTVDMVKIAVLKIYRSLPVYPPPWDETLHRTNGRMCHEAF